MNKDFRRQFLKHVLILHKFILLAVSYRIIFILLYVTLFYFYEELITSVLILSVLNFLEVTSEFLIMITFVVVNLLTGS
jgi:hypothetical protein